MVKTKDKASPAPKEGPKSISDNIKAIRRACVPLVLWESYDPKASIAAILKAIKPKEQDKPSPAMSWDVVSGLIGLNPAGKDLVSVIQYEDGMALPVVLKLMQKISTKAIIFIHQFSRTIEWEGVIQGVWLLRDTFKQCGATLILFSSGMKLPPELIHDVIEIKEVPPTGEEITQCAEALTKDYPSLQWDRVETVDALKGLLSMFDVEQTFALNTSSKGVSVPGIWERKIARLKGSTGAEIKINNPNFGELSGCENVKGELQGFINGVHRPGIVLFMDEVEKMFSGAGTDLSGTTTNMLGQWLTWTQERRVRGFLLAGIPGAGKSWTAETCAGEAGVPLFKLNVSETKGSLVGQSEAQMKSALAAVDAIAGGGSVLMVASCNWVDLLTPDVMGRFTMGTFFYDYPDDMEREALLWQYFTKYDLGQVKTEELKATKGWVGREIENACFKAQQYRRNFLDVAKNIVPSCQSQRVRLEKLRQSCADRFLSSGHAGPYKYLPMEEHILGIKPQEAAKGRALNLQD